MRNLHTCFRYIVASLILAFMTITYLQIDVLASENESRSTTSNELLVKYKIMPRSIAAFPILPVLTDDTEFVAPSVELLKFPEGVDIDKISQQLEENPFIETIEPNYERQLMASVNDPLYYSQWWVPHTKADRLWPLVGNQKISTVVAVIDSGIDGNHPDLVGRIATGGFNFVEQNSDVTDDNGHGTNVAGVIAANSNNGLGIAGVSGPYNVSVLPLKTARADGTSTVADNVKAIDYAIRKNVDVINISQGGPSFSTFEQDAIRRAVDAGILIVASAGNDAQKGNPPMYPASYADVISVGSIGKMNSRSTFSNYNDLVDLVAPGEQISTTDRYNSYVYVSGTSFSAPIVAGTAAILKATVPELTIQQMTDILTSTATDLGVPGKDPQYGYGMLNAEKAAAKLANLNVPVTGLKLNKTAVNLLVSEKTILSATVTPDNATNRRVIWTTSTPSVALVSQLGEVTAKSAGVAEIMATTEDGQIKASVTVTVSPLEPFSGNFPDLNIDDTQILSVNFNKALDENAPYGLYIKISKRADGQGEFLSLFKAKVNPDKPTQLYIAPYTKWESGTYYLIISKGMKGKDGKALGEDVKVRFTVW